MYLIVLVLQSSVGSDTTVLYSDKPSIHYPPIYDVYVNIEYFFSNIQMIQLWLLLSNSLLQINKQNILSLF